MKRRPWESAEVIGSIREDVWRFITQAARVDEEAYLEAAALLQMKPYEVRALAAIQFIASEEVARLLEQMPFLVRRLRTTTVVEEEVSAERVRGSIRWGATLSGRAASGLPHLYATSPARRAFETPENEVLGFALQAIRSVGRGTGWHRSASPELGLMVRDRVEEAERWLRTRMLAEMHPAPPGPQLLARVRASRARKRYQAALDVVDLHFRYIRRVDREALRAAIEAYALVTTKDDVLLELLCGFSLERALKNLGWTIRRPGLVRGGLFLTGQRAGQKLRLYYQRTPEQLSVGSAYRSVQQSHLFARASGLIPDFVLELDGAGVSRWLVIEVKGVQRPVWESAREALQNLLAYRRAFEPVLAGSPSPYGLGIAWGASLAPSTEAEIALCTPDTIEPALTKLLGA